MCVFLCLDGIISFCECLWFLGYMFSTYLLSPLLQEEEVLRGQELENAVSDSDYTKAIQLAFELRRPRRLLELFSQLCRYSSSMDLTLLFFYNKFDILLGVQEI